MNLLEINAICKTYGALDTLTSGKVLIDGKCTIFRHRNIGFIFRVFNLIPELSVEQNITFPLLPDYQKSNEEYFAKSLTVLTDFGRCSG